MARPLGFQGVKRRGAALVRAREYFEQATARDPQFARAYAALGLTWISLAAYNIVPYPESIPAAVVASERAVALDSLSADSWAALGLARTFERQWRAADVATERAVRLDARNAVAQAVRARLLAAVGRADEAADAAILSVTLDPGSVGYLGMAAVNLALAGRFPEAIRFANQSWEIDSTLSNSGQIARVLWEGGQAGDARRRAEVVLRLSSDAFNSAVAIAVIAEAGDPGRAATVFAQQRARFAGRDAGGFLWATAWLALGDTAQALSAFEEAEQRGIFGVTIPLGNRVFDPVRASPRFAALVRKAGLDVALFTSPNGGRPR